MERKLSNPGSFPHQKVPGKWVAQEQPFMDLKVQMMLIVMAIKSK
jgi:hypothetical protein